VAVLNVANWYSLIMKKLDTKAFIERANLRHNFKFDYSLSNYVNSMTKVTVVCKEHGPWDVLANDHMNKSYGCPSCGVKSRASKRSLGLNYVLAKAKEIHGDKYDYSNVTSYINQNQKLHLRCKIHDEPFFPTVDNHIGHNESGCPLCANEFNGTVNAKPIEEFIKLSKELHDIDNYDYTTLTYSKMTSPASMVCNYHGMFTFNPKSHLRGAQCCSRCDNAKSRSEDLLVDFLCSRFMEHFTIQLNTRPILNPSTKGRLELDIVFVEDAIAIEYNGHQHYDENSYFNKIAKCKSSIFDRDEYKRYWCKKNGITLIEIPYWEFNAQQSKAKRDEFLEELAHDIEEILCVE